jgi:hypothetical protein
MKNDKKQTKDNRQNITEILLKVALTIQTNQPTNQPNDIQWIQ